MSEQNDEQKYIVVYAYEGTVSSYAETIIAVANLPVRMLFFEEPKEGVYVFSDINQEMINKYSDKILEINPKSIFSLAWGQENFPYKYFKIVDNKVIEPIDEKLFSTLRDL